MVRFVTAIAAAALLVGTLAGTALAAKPTMVRQPIDFSVEDQLCVGMGFSYDVELSGFQITRDFGNRVMIKENLHGEAVATNGVTVRVHHSLKIVVDLVDNTATITGLAFGAWVDGTSLKRMDRGRLVIDIATGMPLFVAGHWPPSPPDAHELTCDMIAAAA